MTWDKLKTLIESLTPEQRQTNVAVYIHHYDETWSVSLMSKVGENTEYDPCVGVLDDDDPFLVVNQKGRTSNYDRP